MKCKFFEVAARTTGKVKDTPVVTFQPDSDACFLFPENTSRLPSSGRLLAPKSRQLIFANCDKPCSLFTEARGYFCVPKGITYPSGFWTRHFDLTNLKSADKYDQCHYSKSVMRNNRFCNLVRGLSAWHSSSAALHAAGAWRDWSSLYEPGKPIKIHFCDEKTNKWKRHVTPQSLRTALACGNQLMRRDFDER